MSRFFFYIVFIAASFRSVCGLHLSDLRHERLEYDLMVKGLHVVHSEMWLECRESSTTIHWTVDTKPVAQMLFHVNNVYQVTIDSVGRVLQSQKSIDQKNIQQKWTVNYDWIKRRAESNQHVSWPIVDGCSNILSMLYDLRIRSLAPGDTVMYALDVESQIWNIKGVVESLHIEGNLAANEIVFHFSPALDIAQRAWKTDIVTNRMGHMNSTLTVHIGPAPAHKPLLVRFGSDNAHIEMRLKDR